MPIPYQPNVTDRPRRPLLTWGEFRAGFLIGFVMTLIAAAIVGVL